MKKTVLITGASSGIGYELSKIFAQKGYRLVIVAIDRENLEQVAQELINKYKIYVFKIEMDLSQIGAGETLYKIIKQKGIDIDILINNAGRAIHGKLLETSLEEQLKIAQLNMITVMTLCKLFGADMVKKKSGKILNVGSIGGFQACPNMSHYFASKAYILILSESLNEEFKPAGVTVTVLCPGATETEFITRTNIQDTIVAHKPFTMSASKVAQAGYSALMQGKALIVTGIINKLWIMTIRFIPRFIAIFIVGFLHENRHFYISKNQ